MLLTHMCLSSPNSIIWYRSKGGDTLQLGMSVVALAMCHGLSGLSAYELNSQCLGDKHPT